MRIIKEIACHMEDEICGAREYAILALEYQYSRPQLAELFHRMSQEELSHYKYLHQHEESIISEMKEKGKNIPKSMENKIAKKHDCLIEKQQEAEMFINMY